MTGGCLVQADELHILVNRLPAPLVITYPLYGCELCRAEVSDDSYLLTFPTSMETLDRLQGECDDLAREMPGYSDLVDALLASGVLWYENLDDFREVLSSYENLTKQVYFGVDTNVLYHGFLTQSGLLDLSQVIITRTVHDEITQILNTKYSGRMIERLQEILPRHRDIIAEFSNKRRKKSRKAAYMAIPEYIAVRDRAMEIAPPADTGQDSRKNDRIIVRSLRGFEEEKYGLPVLLTADTYMADLCRAEGVEYFLLDRPWQVTDRECGPDQLVRLLVMLSAVFGVITVNGTIIFSEYGGKSEDTGERKLVITDRDAVRELREDLALCRRLRDLHIDR
ncbi:MAG: hypothetical protein ACP5C4_01430 [Methanomicrobiales archaeon]